MFASYGILKKKHVVSNTSVILGIHWLSGLPESLPAYPSGRVSPCQYSRPGIWATGLVKTRSDSMVLMLLTNWTWHVTLGWRRCTSSSQPPGLHWTCCGYQRYLFDGSPWSHVGPKGCHLEVRAPIISSYAAEIWTTNYDENILHSYNFFCCPLIRLWKRSPGAN